MSRDNLEEYQDPNGQLIRETRSRITLRYVYPQEMARLLSLHGFEIVHTYGDWNSSSLTSHSAQMVYVCRKNAG